LVVHLGACAAVQLGQAAEARTLWQQVARAFPKMTPADENLSQSALFGANAAAESVPQPSIIELQNALPAMFLQRMRGGHKQALQVIDQFDASADYLDALYRFGSEQLRQIAQIILVRRLERQDRAAADVLLGFARLPIGTAQERYRLLGMLRENGILAADQEVEVWDGRKLTRIKLVSTEIHREPAETDLPPHLDERLSHSIMAYTEGRYEEAEADLLAILAARPDYPAALGNLAAIRDGQGDHQEATRLLEQAVAANPEYLFGRCSLARRRIFDGDLDAAEALLEGLGQLPRIHVQDFLNLHGALAMLAAARGDNERARQSLRAIEPVVVDADERRRFNDIRRSLISVSKDEAFKQELSREMFMPLFEGRSAGR
jgi:tetratricopeptide (TPR) repeat protein